MQIKGRRVCIAGSAGNRADPKLLLYAHQLVTELTRTITAHGGLISCGVGKNPNQNNDPALLPVVFDWTVLDAVHKQLKDGGCVASTPQGPVFATVATTKTASQIPADKMSLWEALLGSSAVLISYIPPDWTAGAIRRQRLASLSDILLVISGAEGTEHLASEFVAQGKPVIPFDLDVGASTREGPGVSQRLFAKLRSKPQQFFKSHSPERTAALLTRMETSNGNKPVAQVVSATLDLITTLLPPDAFYVRLLNPSAPDFPAVERYFRNVVDPVVKAFGYHPVEMGRSDATSAWMNVQIFDSIHYCAVCIVDITGLRNNCFMELGYALGRQRPVLITALEGTTIPFDASPIETRSWGETVDNARRISELEDYWKRSVNRQPLVEPRDLH